LTICFADFKRAGQKVEGFLLFVPLRRFYSVLFVRDNVKNDLTA
jgi:hypothetical protein